MKKHVMILASVLMGCWLQAQDWKNVPVPADPGPGMKWELQSQYSDDFNYNGKGNQFQRNWKDSYFNGWSGPGLTEWRSNESVVTGGNLQIKASRKSGTNRVYCGVVTSKTKVIYPIYMEARIKVSNLELSSNFWMLSQDDTREIDVLEVYGGAAQTWFAQRMSTNFHVFNRDPNNNRILRDYNDQTHNTLPGNAYWRNAYHTFGVYWKSPTEVYFYIDGKKTQNGSWSQVRMVDKATGEVMNKNQYRMDKPVFMIIDTEDHDWRSNQGIVASDAALADASRNTMYVDWVRTYKPVSETGTGGGNSSIVANGSYYLTSPSSGQRLIAPSWSNFNAQMHDPGNFNDQRWIFNHLGNNIYTIRNKGTNRYLEVPYANCADGENVSTYISAGSNHQKWKVIKNADDTYSLQPAHCLNTALDRRAGAKNANIQIWEYWNQNINQKWNIRPDDNKIAMAETTPTKDKTLQLYPNPVGDILVLNNLDQTDKISIYDLLGNRIIELTAKSTEEKVNTSNLGSGIYIVSILGKRKIQFLKK